MILQFFKGRSDGHLGFGLSLSGPGVADGADMYGRVALTHYLIPYIYAIDVVTIFV